MRSPTILWIRESEPKDSPGDLHMKCSKFLIRLFSFDSAALFSRDINNSFFVVEHSILFRSTQLKPIYSCILYTPVLVGNVQSSTDIRLLDGWMFPILGHIQF